MFMDGHVKGGSGCNTVVYLGWIAVVVKVFSLCVLL